VVVGVGVGVGVMALIGVQVVCGWRSGVWRPHGQSNIQSTGCCFGAAAPLTSVCTVHVRPIRPGSQATPAAPNQARLEAPLPPPLRPSPQLDCALWQHQQPHRQRTPAWSSWGAGASAPAHGRRSHHPPHHSPAQAWTAEQTHPAAAQRVGGVQGQPRLPAAPPNLMGMARWAQTLAEQCTPHQRAQRVPASRGTARGGPGDWVVCVWWWWAGWIVGVTTCLCAYKAGVGWTIPAAIRRPSWWLPTASVRCLAAVQANDALSSLTDSNEACSSASAASASATAACTSANSACLASRVAAAACAAPAVAGASSFCCSVCQRLRAADRPTRLTIWENGFF